MTSSRTGCAHPPGCHALSAARRRASSGARLERGLALIVAMLVAALSAAIAAALITDQSLWRSRVEHRGEQVQAQSLARAGIKWAQQILATAGGSDVLTTLGDPWALPLPPTPIEGGSVEGRIVDAQGFLNLGSLGTGPGSSEDLAAFGRLADALGLPPGTAGRMADWVEARRRLAAAASPDGFFIPLVADELAAVPGLAPATLASLMPYVVALPPRTPLNVNTAPAAILAAAVPGLGRAAADALAESRRTKPFASIADFRARLPADASPGNATRFAVGSSYFLVQVKASEGDSIAKASALIRHERGVTSMVWQRLD